MGRGTAESLQKCLVRDYDRYFCRGTAGVCSHSERILTAVNGLSQVYRQDHLRGDNDTNFFPQGRGWTPSCNQQDFQEICERCEAKHPPVMFPAIEVVWQPGSRGQIRCQRKEETIRNQKRVCR